MDWHRKVNPVTSTIDLFNMSFIKCLHTATALSADEVFALY